MAITICVCSPEGDPTARTTWSGTPANLCRVLDDLGRLHCTVDSSRCLPSPLPRIARAIAKLYYATPSGADRGFLTRWLRANHLARFVAAQAATDVLHLSTLDLPLASDHRPVRHYLYCDTTWDLWRRGHGHDEDFSPRLLRDSEALECAAYHQMTHLFPIGEYVRDNLVSRYGVPPERVTAVGTGCGGIQPYFGEKDYAAGPILFVAKLNFEGKGGPLLIEGFKRALKINPTLRLKIVGDPAYRALVGDVPGIEVLGFVSLEQLQRLFDEAALFALPAFNEPWGLVYLEALRCRTPVLALRRFSTPEITANGAYGFLLEDGTPDAVAAALVEAFSDPARLARMGAAGQASIAERYTWEQTVGRIVETVDRCAA